MRVLLLCHNFPPEFRGGVERVVESLANSLLRKDHAVHVLAGSERIGPVASLHKELLGKLPVTRYVRGPGYRNPVFPFDGDFAPILQKVLMDFRPDIAHVHHHWNLSDDVIRRIVAGGVPVVATLHDFFASCSLFFRLPELSAPCDVPQGAAHCAPCLEPRLGLPRDALGPLVAFRAGQFRLEFASASAVMVPSRSHGEALKSHLPQTPIVVPLGTPHRRPRPSQSKFPEGPLTVLHFGHFSDVKGTRLLMETVSRLDPGGTRVRLILAGSDLAGSLSLSQVEVVPQYDAELLADLAARSDVAVFPSFARETYGLVVDEALRLGLPVVVSDRGALAERVGTRGKVMRAGDASHLAEILKGFLSDPSSLAALVSGSHGPLLDEDEHAELCLEIYARVCKEGVPTMSDVDGAMRARVTLLRDLLAQVLMLQGQGGGPS